MQFRFGIFIRTHTNSYINVYTNHLKLEGTGMSNIDTGAANTKKFCTDCGATLAVESRFCAGCGSEQGANYSNHEDAAQGNSPQMPLLMAWASYFGSVIALALLGKLSVGVGIGLYLVIGFVMTRIVMPRLIQWHPMYDTLYNVTSAKLWMFVLWPFQMISLLFRLTINKIL